MNRSVSLVSFAACVLGPCALLDSCVSTAQSVAEPTASFEVVSVKPAPNFSLGQRIGVQIFESGRVTANYMTVKALLAYAYNVRDYQILGEPDWASSIRYDIAAKAGGDGRAPEDKVREMIQNLLAERFQVRITRQPRDMAIYELVVAKGGAKIKKSDPEVTSMATLELGRMTGKKMGMDRLARALTTIVGRPVIDRTGLEGEYDFSLQSPDIGVLMGAST